MKFQPETLEGVNVVSRHEPGRLWVGAAEHRASVLVPWAGPVQPWGASSFEELSAEHFERIAALAPEVVIFGSGGRIRFVPPQQLRPLIERGIGLETMDSAAAARTYNVLVNERRRVVGAFLLGPAAA
jgi:uncharacterized protein